MQDWAKVFQNLYGAGEEHWIFEEYKRWIIMHKKFRLWWRHHTICAFQFHWLFNSTNRKCRNMIFNKLCLINHHHSTHILYLYLHSRVIYTVLSRSVQTSVASQCFTATPLILALWVLVRTFSSFHELEE